MWNRWRSTRHRYFNPRPREGGRRPLVLREISIDEFQSTPPRGGATAMEDNKPADTWISIHAPARGGVAAYQLKIDALEISIHAPARGGRHISCGQIFHIKEFQSTPPRGERPMSADAALPRHHFNPRPREGSDVDRLMPEDSSVISIHAPARGATGASPSRPWLGSHFNPRPREGSDETARSFPILHKSFQSTPPRGERRDVHHSGGVYRAISIHAPARGATTKTSMTICTSRIFQSTPPRGERLLTRHLCYPDCNFNPRPREGSDSKDAQFYLRIFDKQVELLRFWGKMRGGCLRNPEKDRRFLGKSLANLPEISGHLDFAGA